MAGLILERMAGFAELALPEHIQHDPGHLTPLGPVLLRKTHGDGAELQLRLVARVRLQDRGIQVLHIAQKRCGRLPVPAQSGQQARIGAGATAALRRPWARRGGLAEPRLRAPWSADVLAPPVAGGGANGRRIGCRAGGARAAVPSLGSLATWWWWIPGRRLGCGPTPIVDHVESADLCHPSWRFPGSTSEVTCLISLLSLRAKTRCRYNAALPTAGISGTANFEPKRRADCVVENA